MGVLKDVILLDYGPVSQLIVLLKCDWICPRFDKWGNPAYRCYEDRFLLSNFWHLKGQVDEPYVFLVQVQ